MKKKYFFLEKEDCFGKNRLAMTIILISVIICTVVEIFLIMLKIASSPKDPDSRISLTPPFAIPDDNHADNYSPSIFIPLRTRYWVTLA